MSETLPLPPSLSVKPNIELRDQTFEQLIAERNYWTAFSTSCTGWGAGYNEARKYFRACEREIARRQETAK